MLIILKLYHAIKRVQESYQQLRTKLTIQYIVN